jgi:hypothetical protein
MKDAKRPYYVLLTGGKNNAGDFLIKYRAKDLFSEIREDRDIIDVDAWRDRDHELLEIYNNAKAIILTGGPSLRKNMYSGIYNALGNIDDIKVPIIAMAIGWRSFPGEWYQTYNYELSRDTLKLLDRIEGSGYKSSVRDYHSLNVLLHRGYKSFRMTGCAALYDLKILKDGNKFRHSEIDTIGFSLGVSFVNSEKHESNVKTLLLALKEKYKDKVLKVAFHHSLDEKEFGKTYEKESKFLRKHILFAQWLDTNKISFADISGSAENLISFYNKVDLHIGYRVHAHIFMCSQNKASVLIAEDGRGKALKDVINGMILDNEFSNYSHITNQKNTIKNRILRKLNVNFNKMEVNTMLTKDMILNLEMEENTHFARVDNSHYLIKNYFKEMKKFIYQLP